MLSSLAPEYRLHQRQRRPQNEDKRMMRRPPSCLDTYGLEDEKKPLGTLCFGNPPGTCCCFAVSVSFREKSHSRWTKYSLGLFGALAQGMPRQNSALPVQTTPDFFAALW